MAARAARGRQEDAACAVHLENFIQKENWLKETHGFRGFRGRGWK